MFLLPLDALQSLSEPAIALLRWQCLVMANFGIADRRMAGSSRVRSDFDLVSDAHKVKRATGVEYTDRLDCRWETRLGEFRSHRSKPYPLEMSWNGHDPGADGDDLVNLRRVHESQTLLSFDG